MHNAKKPSPKTAIALYGGLASNTTHLKNRETTDRDLKAQKHLIEECNVDPSFVDEMFEAKSDFSKTTLIDYLEDDYISRVFNGFISCPLQVEVVDAHNFYKSREQEFKGAFDHFKKKYNIDILFYNLVDIKNGFNQIISYDTPTISFFEKLLNVSFQNGMKDFSPIYMRKELQLLIRDNISLYHKN